MSYLNINNNYIITFGGGSDKHFNSIYILDIKNEIFYKSKIKLKYKMCMSGCFLENNRIIHIFGGRYTNKHYTINLRTIIPSVLYLEHMYILINYILKINKNLPTL